MKPVGTRDEVRERVVRSVKRIIADRKDTPSKDILARRIGTSPAAVSLWETGSRWPTVEDMVNLCKRYGVSAEYLLLGEGEIFSGAKDSIASRIAELEKRVKVLEKKYR